MPSCYRMNIKPVSISNVICMTYIYDHIENANHYAAVNFATIGMFKD